MNWLVAQRNRILTAVILLLIPAIPTASRLRFDQTIESFFSDDNPDIRLLQKTREDFGGDEFVIVAWREPGLLRDDAEQRYPELSDNAAERISQLSDRLGQLPGVDGDRTRDLVRFLHKAPKNRNIRRALLKLFDGILIGPDQETTAIVLQLFPADPVHAHKLRADNHTASVPVQATVAESRYQNESHGKETAGPAREETIREIRRIVSDAIPEAAVAGEAVQLQDMFDLVERDGNLLYIASLVVLSVILFVIFRQLRWVLASVGIVVASVTMTRAVLVLADAELSMVSSMLNSLVTIISISTTTHIIVHYRELRTSLNAEDAAVRTFRELWHPVLWTVITIAVGFAALLVSEINPVRSFAIMMTLGTMMVLVMTALILPATFASGRHVPVPGRVRMEERIDRVLDRMAFLIDRHPMATTVLSLLLTGVTLPGLFLMQVETDFSKNFRDTSPIVRSLKFIESQLGPAGSWDVAFDVPSPVTDEFLNQTAELTSSLKKLRTEDTRLDVLSLNDAVNIPPRMGTAVRRFETLQNRQPELVGSFYSPERQRMRIVLRSAEQQPTEMKLRQIQRVREVVAAYFPGETATASGLFVLMARIIESLLSDQLQSFLWACAGTVVCMAIAFRSLRIGFISLVPNVFPIALVTGSLGLLHIPVNIGTAMIASVAMGFTCSVHYIAVFQESLPSHGLTRSLQIAQGSVGKAVVLAHIALVAGFMVLTVSEFIPLVYFGAILSLSMLGGLISDLVLLPLLLRWTTKVVTESTMKDCHSELTEKGPDLN